MDTKDIHRNMASLAMEPAIPFFSDRLTESETTEELKNIHRLVKEGIVKKDSPIYLAAMKKHQNKWRGIVDGQKHVVEEKMLAERNDSVRYAVKYGDKVPSHMAALMTVSAPAGGAQADETLAKIEEIEKRDEAKRHLDAMYRVSMAKSAYEVQHGPNCYCMEWKPAYTAVWAGQWK
ncbi:uncharacterized protein LY89DRAFT_782583 [Mollisia scopiformis]|uniref:Uncharacterized protein n=1 Tax=Mollisia scopiformis TaxID=149040 RepID=A0A194X811_MOLSC|nr:uncharacterized protein LY89DRAFT_782583 [Mollisia scopiformis]KUJ16303.1 hypothetical protein LY89DRAFT_782583 [Mollisia scopiformis]